MVSALKLLDQRIPSAIRVIIGGGAAMAYAYDIPIATEDIDAVPDRSTVELATFHKEVAAVGLELGIAANWLNDHFSPFLFVLPRDYGDRLVAIYQGKHLDVRALGKEELVLMKCFAGREKDIPHIRTLLRTSPSLKVIDKRLQELLEKKIPGAQKAADLFDDLCGELGLSA